MNDHHNDCDYDPNDRLFDALKVKFQKLSENNLAPPTRATEDSVGYDL